MLISLPIGDPCRPFRCLWLLLDTIGLLRQAFASLKNDLGIFKRPFGLTRLTSWPELQLRRMFLLGLSGSILWQQPPVEQETLHVCVWEMSEPQLLQASPLLAAHLS